MAPESFFYLLTFFAFSFGAVIGSFLNVVIYRIPAGLSIVAPGSRCPNCETPIRWYDNIPIVSWFVLAGNCRKCDVDISPRYAVIEALTGFFGAALWVKIAGPHFQLLGTEQLPDWATTLAAVPWFSIVLAFGFYFFFLALLVVITFVDLDHYLIPHEFTLPGIVLGVVAALVLNSDLIEAGTLHGLWPPVTVSMSVIGLLAGGLSVILLFYLYFAARGIEGVGGGDVTMMALMGAWLGWPALIFVFFAASIQGLIAAGLAAIFGAGFLKDSGEILAQEDPRETADTAKELEKNKEPAEDREVLDENSEVLNENSEVLDENSEVLDENSEVLDDDSESQPLSGLAVPFGPFIALAGIQFFFLGEFLPDWLSMAYLYYGP